MNRPLDPRDALAWALHKARTGHLPSKGCCAVAVFDFAEAEDLASLLGELGAHISYDLELPVSAPARGPKTSDEAAASITDLSDRHYGVYACLQACGPLADFELVDRYRGMRDRMPGMFPAQSASSIRSRRHELHRAGHVELVGGERRPTGIGKGTARVWAAVGDAQAVAA